VPGFRLAHPRIAESARQALTKAVTEFRSEPPETLPMTHQVLARKWRPRDFASLVGQEHVVRALTHALDNARLHHAYLFTGTRGVGKTTIARILAKSLNCETGLSSQPCGKCRACGEIDEGRFPDYLELDAASNRGVDEMAQLLDNAVYAPVSGRYKVYVIDEVHMLSTHAFNAMLKTLEEPPPHVIFILATTDPQKVPVTVLSRCLQFNLKNMAPAMIAQHLAQVLQAEGIEFDAPALTQIGRAAAGSMRDALSLLDQAIAYGGGRAGESEVREMLGVVDRRYLQRVLDALLADDGPALVAVADEMLSNNAPFGRTLADLAAWLQRIALAQVGAFGADDEDPEVLRAHAQRLSPEILQVYYQIAIHGARDLSLAPDEHTGFSMTLLRMLAFSPSFGAGGAPAAGAQSPPSRAGSAGRHESPLQSRPGPAATPIASQGAAPTTGASRPTSTRPASEPSPAAAALAAARAARTPDRPAQSVDAGAASPSRPTTRQFDGNWTGLAEALGLVGLAAQLMQQSQLLEHDGLSFKVRVPIRPLAEAGTVTKVRDALASYFGAPVRLSVEVGSIDGQTAIAVANQQRAERLDEARAALEADPFVQTLLTDFGGRIVPDSVKPIDP
jgi:DNA polymerase-3 subunit gamma/tau